MTGGWSEEGVFTKFENPNSTTITCITKHLTSFAVLVDSSGTISKPDSKKVSEPQQIGECNSKHFTITYFVFYMYWKSIKFVYVCNFMLCVLQTESIKCTD